MRALRHILISGLLVVASASAAKSSDPLAAVAGVDLTRYAGVWHEVALLPNRFQAQCVSDTTATYVRQADGSIEVTNRCRLADGGVESIVGAARMAKGETTGAKLQVRFAPAWLGFLPMVWGKYWVIELDTDYQYAVVSEPNKKFLWILARTPTLDAARYDAIVKRLAEKGFDTTKIKKATPSGTAK